MKKLFISLMAVLTLFVFINNVEAKIETKSFHAVVTAYWPGEVGSTFDCNGNRLHSGVAAVDFDVIPKGSVLNLGGVTTVVASDCGGRDVISRKASRERGIAQCPVIDVWMPSRGHAERFQAKFGKSVIVTYVDNPKMAPIIKNITPKPIIKQIAPQRFAIFEHIFEQNYEYVYCHYNEKTKQYSRLPFNSEIKIVIS